MKLNVLKLVLDAGLVVKFVLFLLIAFSIISWAIIFHKRRVLRRSRRNSEKFLEEFWNQKNMETAYRKAKEMTYCPVGAVFAAGYQELLKARESAGGAKVQLKPDEVAGILENVERSLRRTALAQQAMLEQRVTFLATTGSSAPFIGLFGTVWGIMNSFLNIGASGATNLAVVAPGISEALIATAVGLFAAIPAVIGYNYCVAHIRSLQREMDTFTNDFLNIIKRQLGAA
ncbi:MAG TPA: protein TolQ [Bdellovibrionota bacterium]|nr:protein TolQ [Bdellovibrionota bacterium]